MENETNNSTNTDPKPHKLTQKQKDSLVQSDKVIAEIRTKFPNALLAAKEIDKWAKSLSGSTNEGIRVTMISAMLGVAADDVVAQKCGVVNLGIALVQRFMDEPVTGETVKVFKAPPKVKEVEPTESENALAQVFKRELVVSEAIKALSVDDTQKIAAAVHAATQTGYRRLGTKELPFPRQAVDFVNSLIGVSNGSLESFEITDGLIAEFTGVSSKTIQRGRDKLVEWMIASGKGIVDIKQAEKKPTTYKVNLLSSITAIIHSMFNSTHASPDAVLAVASLSGKLLTEGTEKLQATVSPEDFKAAQDLDTMLNEAIDITNKPKVKLAAASESRSDSATTKRITKIAERFQSALEAAGTLATSDTVDAEGKAQATQIGKNLEELQVAFGKARVAIEKDPAAMKEVNTDTFEEGLTAAETGLKEISKTGLEKAREAAAEARKTKPLPVVAAEYVATFALDEQVNDERQARIENFTEDVYYLAAICDHFNDREAKIALALELTDRLNKAFEIGKYGKPTGAPAAA